MGFFDKINLRKEIEILNISTHITIFKFITPISILTWLWKIVYIHFQQELVTVHFVSSSSNGEGIGDVDNPVLLEKLCPSTSVSEHHIMRTENVYT